MGIQSSAMEIVQSILLSNPSVRFVCELLDFVKIFAMAAVLIPPFLSFSGSRYYFSTRFVRTCVFPSQ